MECQLIRKSLELDRELLDNVDFEETEPKRVSVGVGNCTASPIRIKKTFMNPNACKAPRIHRPTHIANKDPNKTYLINGISIIKFKAPWLESLDRRAFEEQNQAAKVV